MDRLSLIVFLRQLYIQKIAFRILKQCLAASCHMGEAKKVAGNNKKTK
jgi:hypothetical protein